MQTVTFNQNHLKLIQSVAKAIIRKFPHYVSDARELYFTGYMALKQAEEKYQTGRGAQFKTYASRCIYRAMLKELAQIRNVVNVPEKQSFDVNYLTINKDQPWEWNLWETDREDGHNHQRVETLDKLLGELNPGDRELVQRRYGICGDPWTLKQLGESRGVSLQAVHKKLHSIEQGLHDSLCA